MQTGERLDRITSFLRSARVSGMLKRVSGLTVTAYAEHYKSRWDEFLGRSKNGTFLFRRDYMEYHSDRYPDGSLIALNENGTVKALLPATRLDDQLVSHEGLTYGGWVTDQSMTVQGMLELFEASKRHLVESGVATFIYKSIPHIYHRTPAEEDLYALLAHGAELYRRDALSVLSYAAESEWEERLRWRMRKGGKAGRAGFEVRRSEDYDRFWHLLAANLERRHGIRPVHSLEEIQLLAGRFPDQIQLFGMYRGNAFEAGVIVYLTDTVCHAQYSVSSDEGREVRALDFVFAHIINAFRGQVRYFDFGISSERDGSLNRGLLEYKQRFGARTVVHDFYRLTLSTP